MSLFLIGIIPSIFFILFLFKEKEDIIYLLLPINLYFDIILGVFPESSIHQIFRTSILLFTFFYYFSYFLKGSSKFFLFPILLLYWFLLIFFSSDISMSFRVYLQIFFIFAFFLIGLGFKKSIIDLNKLLSSITISCIMLVLNFVLSNFFQIGENPYSDDLIYSGNFQTTTLNIIPFVILLIPLFGSFSTKSSFIITTFSALALILFLILFGRRSPILVILIGFSLYFILYFRFKIISSIKFILISVPLLISLLFYYSDQINLVFDQRFKRFEDGGLETELRYIETIAIFEEIFSSKDLTKLFFGTEIFNSIGNYGNRSFGERPIHIDWNRILHGSGLIGLILYILMFISLYLKSLKVYFNYKSYSYMWINTDYFLVSSALIVFITVLFSFSFVGGLSAITFRLFGFMVCGLLLNYLNK